LVPRRPKLTMVTDIIFGAGLSLKVSPILSAENKSETPGFIIKAGRPK